MTFLWIALLTLAIGALLYWRGRKPMVHRAVPLADLPRFVDGLVGQFAPGGILLADRRPGPGFLQIALRTVEPDGYTLEFGFPELDWSRAAFSRVLTAVSADGFEPTTDTGLGAVSRFMRVQMASPAPEVSLKAQRLFTVVAAELEWGEQPVFDVRFLGQLDIPRIRTGMSAMASRGA
jgi:hypothetical protein